MVWVKALNGEDVFEQGDGWVFHARTQGWLFEPNLLTMPALPLEVRVRNEARALRTGWPSLREAWSLNTTANTDTFLLLRLWVLLVALYEVVHLPFWVIAKINGQWMDSMWTGGLLCVSATCCMFLIWFDHLWQVDRRKGQAVAVGALAVWAWRAEQRHRQGGH